MDAERCGLNPAEESGSINDETGGVVKAMVHLKYRTLPDCPKRRITNDEDNHQLKNVNGDEIHRSSKQKVRNTATKKSKKLMQENLSLRSYATQLQDML